MLNQQELKKQQDKIVKKSSSIIDENRTFIEICKKYPSIIGRDIYMVEELQHENNNFDEGVTDRARENRLFKIGIVGEVKAGKSSFVNSLIFDGRDFLPYAVTPVTDTLTTITYEKSSKCRAEITRYTAEELEELKKDADFREQLNGTDKEIAEMLPCVPLTSDGKADFMEKLADYIDKDGEFTPFAKEVAIFINNPILEGIEVIDTPGTNDPIVLRETKTKALLEKCDCVFFISDSTDFVAASEIELLCCSIGEKGINDCRLIGSRFDEAIIQHSNDTKNKRLEQVMRNTKKGLSKSAKDRIAGYVRDKQLDENTPAYRLLMSFAESQEDFPMTAAKLVTISKKISSGSLKDTESQILDDLKRTFRQFVDALQNSEKLNEWSGIPEINDYLEELQKVKDQGIIERFSDFYNAKCKNLEIIKNAIKSSLNTHRDKIASGDIQKLRQDSDKAKKTITGFQDTLNNLIEDSILGIDKHIKNLIERITEAQVESSKVPVCKEGIFKDKEVTAPFWKFWKSTEFIKVQVGEKNYVNGADFISNIKNFALDIKDELSKLFDEDNNSSNAVISVQNLKDEIIKSLQKKIVDADLIDALERPFRRIVGKLILKKPIIPANKFIDDIAGLNYYGKDITELQNKLRSSLDDMTSFMEGELTEIRTYLDGELNKFKNEFCSEVEKELNEDIKKYEEQISQQIQTLSSFEQLFKEIDNCKN